MKKRILLYSTRTPKSNVNADGGASTALNIIESLYKDCILDVAFLNLDNQTFIDKRVNKVFPYDAELIGDKFQSIADKRIINKVVLKDYRNYDLIIVLHISGLMGLEDYDDDFWNRVVLYPMFLTPSYIKSGETVPTYYTEAEKKTFSKIKKVITPSTIEKEEIVNIYGVDELKIKVIPRGVSHVFEYNPCPIIDKKNINICMVGSIKKQKNYLRALKVIKILKDLNINPTFHIVGSIQDEIVYQSLVKYISENGLNNNVVFHFTISQMKLNKLFKKCHIAISSSNWETFGRGIYEGIHSGKPTFIFFSLEEVRKFVGESSVLYYCDDELDMAKKIIYLIDNYSSLARVFESEFLRISSLVSIEKEEDELKKVLLGWCQS